MYEERKREGERTHRLLTGQGRVGGVGAEGILLVIGAAENSVTRHVEQNDPRQPIPLQLRPAKQTPSINIH